MVLRGARRRPIGRRLVLDPARHRGPMSTRLERFEKTRARHRARNRKFRARGWRWVQVGDAWVRSGRKWDWFTAGKQAPLDMLQSSYEHGEPVEILASLGTQMVEPAEWRKPAVPWMSGGTYTASRLLNRHFEGPVHGYHRKRVQLVSRVEGRMDGITRRLWFEGLFYMNNGYFRDVDPAGRHPSETDVNNGSPPDDPAPWPGIPLL